MALLSIQVVAPDSRTVLLVLSGDLDYVTVKELTALTLEPGFSDLVMDLSGLAFVDSSGLAALVRLYNATTAGEARFRVSALTPNLRRVLAMTALDGPFNLPVE